MTAPTRGATSVDLDRLSVAGLVILAGASGVVGIWALLAPESFFRDFPGTGLGWVALMPPYNEHLVRDVGGLTAAMAALLGAAAARRSRLLAAAALGAWLVANVPHTLFHLANLASFPPSDALAQSALQLGLVALALGLALRAAWRGGWR